MKRYAKNDGAARRRFFAIYEKPICVVKMTPPPTRAKVNVAPREFPKSLVCSRIHGFREHTLTYIIFRHSCCTAKSWSDQRMV